MKPTISGARPLVLASTSRYRADLLRRLNLPFQTIAPAVDETAQPGETPPALAQRLARAKAQAVAAKQPDRWVLGSDQVPAFEQRVFPKPGDRASAIEQLLACSGKTVLFHTAVALAGDGCVLEEMDTTTVRFRALTRAEVERYLDAEPAYDSAGSFKAEGLGITLFEAIESRDPTALIGLPLIIVRRLLSQAGYSVP